MVSGLFSFLVYFCLEIPLNCNSAIFVLLQDSSFSSLSALQGSCFCISFIRKTANQLSTRLSPSPSTHRQLVCSREPKGRATGI